MTLELEMNGTRHLTWVLASFDIWGGMMLLVAVLREQTRGEQVMSQVAGDSAVVAEGRNAWRMGVFQGTGQKGQEGFQRPCMFRRGTARQ